MTDKQYVVMFSGGIGSWATARRLVDEHGPDKVLCLFADVKGNSTDPHVGEDEDTYRFIDDAIAQLQCRYVRVADGRNIWEVFKDERYLGNSRIASCSHKLKQKPAREWLKANTTPDNSIIAIGIDWTETHRMPKIVKGYDPYEVVFPMAEPPFMDKQAMIRWAEDCGIRPPRLYALGFSHNNCGGGCVKAGQAQFRKLLEVMPERYAAWEKGEQGLREYLDKDVTILREQVQGEYRRLPLTVLRQRQPDQCDVLDIGGCGCFIDGDDMELDDEG